MRRLPKVIAASVLIVAVASAGAYAINRSDTPAKQLGAVSVKAHAAIKPKPVVATPAPTSPTPAPPPNHCNGNTLDKMILVSISARHLWACNQTTEAYDSAVITGMDFLAADLTPTGTYHIYGKQTDQTLRGSDSTGSWNDPVSYWMPFLDNQYGAYGFHDATWRPANAFGNVSPDSSDASHGCVELPLATAAWIYNWAPIGTTITIES